MDRATQALCSVAEKGVAATLQENLMRSIQLVAACGVLILGRSSAVGMELPAGQTITFYFHETPTDPDSPIKTAIHLRLTAIERSSDAVGWRIAQVHFERALSDGTVAEWREDLPDVISDDGLWWVEHEEPTNPQRSEFKVLPWLVGTAETQDAKFSDLDYDVIGEAPPANSIYATTARVSYRLQAANPSEPIEPVNDDNDDEPVEIPGGTNDPYLTQ